MAQLPRFSGPGHFQDARRAGRPGCEFKPRPRAVGAWRRDATATRRRGRPRYSIYENALAWVLTAEGRLSPPPPSARMPSLLVPVALAGSCLWESSPCGSGRREAGAKQALPCRKPLRRFRGHSRAPPVSRHWVRRASARSTHLATLHHTNGRIGSHFPALQSADDGPAVTV